MLINRLCTSKRRASLVDSSYIEKTQPAPDKHIAYLHPICTLKNTRMFLRRILDSKKPHNANFFKTRPVVHSNNSSFSSYNPINKRQHNLLRWPSSIPQTINNSNSRSSSYQDYSLHWQHNSEKWPYIMSSINSERDGVMLKPYAMQLVPLSQSRKKQMGNLRDRRAASVSYDRTTEIIKPKSMMHRLFNNEMIEQKLCPIKKHMKVGECTQTEEPQPKLKKIPLHKITIQMK